MSLADTVSPCIEIDKHWSPSERWVLSRVCDHLPAAMKEAVLDKNEKRALSGKFIAFLLSNSIVSTLVERNGLHLIDAEILDDVDLSNSDIKVQITVEDSVFKGDVNLESATTNRNVIFKNTNFEKILNLRYFKSNRSIYIGNFDYKTFEIPLRKTASRPRLAKVDLSRSQFDGDIVFGNVQIEDWAKGIYARSGSSIIFDECEADSLNFSQSTVKNQFIIVDCEIGSGKNNSPSLESINLYSAQIGQSLYFNRSRVYGRIYANNVVVQGGVQTQKGTFYSISAASSSIGGTLDLGSTSVTDNSKSTNSWWSTSSVLDLRGSKLGGIVFPNSPSVWPANIVLDGATYSYLRHFDNTLEMDASVPPNWHKRLLSRNSVFSAQPYEHLAKMLRDSGNGAEANELLYEARNRQLQLSLDNEQWLFAIWQILFLVFIGYGYRIWYAAIWAICFVIVGALIFRKSDEAKIEQMPYGFSFSFDRLLPLIKLRDRHYKIEFGGWQRYYFYFHQIMGYILGSFLLAGLSGLTK